MVHVVVRRYLVKHEHELVNVTMSEAVEYTGSNSVGLHVMLEVLVPTREHIGGIYALVVFALFPLSYWLFGKGECLRWDTVAVGQRQCHGAQASF